MGPTTEKLAIQAANITVNWSTTVHSQRCEVNSRQPSRRSRSMLLGSERCCSRGRSVDTRSAARPNASELTAIAQPAPTVATSTPPAATSLARSTSGWNSGEARSHRLSMAVFKASAVHTPAMASTTTAHSTEPMRSRKPRSTATIVATAWIHALCWEDSKARRPRPA